jgi:hypothetical protein
MTQQMERTTETAGGIVLAMFGIGVGIALVAAFTGAWISATVMPDLGAAEEEVVSSYTPLAFLSIAALSAPVVAGILGIVNGDSVVSPADAAVVGVACLFGATLMILVAGAGIAVSEPTGPQVVDDGSNGGDTTGNGDDSASATPGVLDLVGLAGLGGIGALVSGFVAGYVD